MAAYTNEMAQRAVRRHERRDVDSRLNLIRALLCSVANDSEPVYSGVDPETGPYEGPEMWRDAIKSLAYFVASARSRGNMTDAEIEAAIVNAARSGISMARYHRAMSERY